jgi:adenosylhomocysteine nucleosidase
MSASVIIIAALEREVSALVKGWRVVQGSSLGAYRTFEKDEVLVVCAGIGSRAALKAADRVLGRHQPRLLISAGLAGSLVPELKVGEVMIPATIISASTGLSISTGQGSGTLVSSSGVAGPEAKRLLTRQYSAQAIDMEAAVIARAAATHSVPFMAIKAISDEIDFPIPEMDLFIDAHGRFLTGKFLSYIALRPKLWPVVRRLRANTALASQQLCAELRNLIDRYNRQPSVPRTPSASESERKTRAR